MRTKAVLVAVVVCLSNLLLPARAEAIFGKGWLERLSGPGPFTGVTFGQDFVCISRPIDEDVISTFGESPGRHVTVAPSRERIVHAGLVGCNYLPRDTPRLQIGFQASRLSSTDNLLDYSNRPEVGDREVNVSMLLLTMDVRVNRVLDVGTAFGNARFSPDNDPLFGDFTRVVWQPLRVAMRPLSAVLPDRRWEAFTIQLELNHIPAGFKDTDFGARPGTFNEPSELLWNWWVGVDVGKFFWK